MIQSTKLQACCKLRQLYLCAQANKNFYFVISVTNLLFKQDHIHFYYIYLSPHCMRSMTRSWRLLQFFWIIVSLQSVALAVQNELELELIRQWIPEVEHDPARITWEEGHVVEL
jgi:hypothetical protein